MPHAEIKYSNNLAIDANEMFSLIENIINRHDSNSGECKCRAYPYDQYKYPHILITITMLTKPHRDETFTRQLIKDIEARLKKRIRQSCYFSLLIEYSPSSYITNEHLIDGDELQKYQPANSQ